MLRPWFEHNNFSGWRLVRLEAWRGVRLEARPQEACPQEGCPLEACPLEGCPLEAEALILPDHQLEECPLEACPPGGVSSWRRVLLEACPLERWLPTVGAAQRAEGAIASQKSELNFNYSSIHSDDSHNLWHMPVSFLAKLEDGDGTLAKCLNRFIFSSAPVLKCSVMSYFILRQW